MSKYVKCLGTSSYFPGEPIKFEDINSYLGDLNRVSPKLNKWINRVQPLMRELLGVEYCYYAFDRETREYFDDNLTMSVKSAQMALDEAELKAEDIDLLIFGGNHSEQMPPLSVRIQEELGIDICSEFHIHSNCTSIYKAIDIAYMYLKSGRFKNALVISSCVSSSFFIPEFYNQEQLTKEDVFLRWYLCDGAGAMVFSAEDKQDKGFYLKNSYIESAGGNKESAMGNRLPARWNNPIDTFDKGLHHIRQVYLNQMKGMAHKEEDGKTIFYAALKRMLEQQSIPLEDLKYFVVNMPSKSVREYIMNECVELGIPTDKVYSAVEEVGYAGPPAAVISIDQILKKGDFKNGDLVFSFVMEVSKFMQAGFVLEYVEEV